MPVDTKSRWNRSQIIRYRDRDGKPLRRQHFDVMPRYTDIDRPGNRIYRWQQGDDWGRTAGLIYHDENKWWVLAEFNQVIDPFDELVPGKQAILASNFDVEFDVTNFEFAVFVDGDLGNTPL